MSYTLSDFESLCPADPPGSFGASGLGWVSYLVTLGTGDWIWVTLWVNNAYSALPEVNADQSDRSLSGDAYAGFTTLDTWLDVSGTEVTAVGSDGDLTTAGGCSPGILSDSTAMAEVATTASDSAVTSEVASALFGQDPVKWGTAAVAGSSVALTHAGDIATATADVTNPYDGGTDSVYDPFSWTSSDPSVATVVDTSGGGVNSCLITEVGPGSCTVTGHTGSRAAPTLTCSIPVTCA